MKRRRMRVREGEAIYHCMTRTVNGERVFGDREKEVLRKMLWQVAEFSGGEILTYAVMSNHFHVLLRFPQKGAVSDAELLRRYGVLYPKPTPHAPASVAQLESTLRAGGEEAEAIRNKLLARMGDVSAFMKTLKQRFSIWFNQTRGRFGTLWAERFKSVVVEGKGNPLQTMAAYIDLNPVRAGLVKDPKDYRFCGYAEAVAGKARAIHGLSIVWSAYAGGSARPRISQAEALSAHRTLIFGKGAEAAGGMSVDRAAAVRVLEHERGVLPKAVVLRCRIRYFSEGAILGSAEFVKSFAEAWRQERGRRTLPTAKPLRGADWGDMTVIGALRSDIFS